jgi:deoxyribonuclease IV
MPLLGAHLSIAGGLALAVERARATGCDALQIFTKSVGQWRARPLEEEDVARFRRAVRASGLSAVVAHASYLINLAAASPSLWRQSVDAFCIEYDRACRLGLDAIVLHPGSGQPADGLPRIATALHEVLARAPRGRTKIALEHTAGQGTNLGHRFEHLAIVLEALRWTPRVTVCLDTCHLWAAGYDLASPRGYARTTRELETVLGLERVSVVHLNDSKKPFGSRVDRHAHIGEGTMGLSAFARVLNDARLARLPMLLETPKSADYPRGLVPDPLDLANLARLRELIRPAGPRRRTPPPRT